MSFGSNVPDSLKTYATNLTFVDVTDLYCVIDLCGWLRCILFEINRILKRYNGRVINFALRGNLVV